MSAYDDHVLRIAEARAANTLHWTPGRVSWGEVCSWLNDPADHKDCGGYVLGELAPTKDVHDGTPCRGFHRRADAVASRGAVVLDADDVADPAALMADVDMLGWEAVAHTTWRSTPAAPRLRLIVLLDRVVTPDDYRRVARWVMNTLGAEAFDAGSAQPERFMWRPSAQDPDDYRRWRVEGSALDVGVALAATPPEDDGTAPRTHEEVPDAPPTRPQLDKAAAVLAKSVREMTSAPEGARNNTLIRLLPTLYRFVLGDCLDEVEVDDQMREAADLAGIGDEYDGRSESAWGYARKDGPQRPAVADPFDDLPPVDVFDQTPTLAKIRQAAHSRLVGAPALLCYVLARVLAEVPPSCALPAVIGGRASLNLGVAVVGRSGAGKSALLAVSRDLMGGTGMWQEDIERNVGSGEGLVQQFLRKDRESGELVPIPDPRRIVLVDEIDQLGATQNRSGATIAPTLRSALTGGSLGQANATAERRRHLKGGVYRLVMLLGVQPTRSETLLRDADAGTPQRLVWVNAADPSIPDTDVAWPGELDWHLPNVSTTVDYPERVKAEVRAVRRAGARGEGGDGLEGHRLLTQLKVAAALALLHREVTITEQWWALAAEVIRASMAVQAECGQVLSDQLTTSRRNAGRLDGVRAQGAAEYRSERVEAIAAAVWRKVAKHADGVKDGNDQRHEPGDGCTARCISRAVQNFPDRAELREVAVANAIQADWVTEQDGRWFVGESRPAAAHPHAGGLRG